MKKCITRLIFSGSFAGSILAACYATAGSVEIKTAEVILPGSIAPQQITYEIVNGEAIYQGDIRLGEVDEYGNLIYGDDFSVKSIIREGSWPDGIVPYAIDSDFSTGERSIVFEAIYQWDAYTPLQFVPYDSSAHDSYIFFTYDDDDGACGSSDIGRRGGKQDVKLNCFNVGTILHEIGHAVGLYHEQSRSDRNEWIEIVWDNIEDGREHNFDKHFFMAADSGDYDYLSIMHYHATAFSKNKKDTIVPLNPLPPGRAIGITNELSEGDIASITAKYSLTESSLIYEGEMCPEGTVCKMADVNGDGRDDIINFYRGEPTVVVPGIGPQPNPGYGDVYVSLANSDGFADSQLWMEGFCVGSQQCEASDMNRDGKADAVAFGGGVTVAKSTSSGFSSPQSLHPDACSTLGEICRLGDFNGDGWTDVLTFKNGASGSIDVYVYFNKIKFFVPDIYYFEREVDSSPYLAASSFCTQAGEVCMTGDFNGDGRDDIVSFHHGAWNDSNEVFVYLSDGRNFNYTGTPWGSDFCSQRQTCVVADVNGDGADDVLAFEGTVILVPDPINPQLHPDSGDVYVAYSNGGNGFGPPLLLSDHMCLVPRLCFKADMDSDKEDEFIDLNDASRFDRR